MVSNLYVIARPVYKLVVAIRIYYKYSIILYISIGERINTSGFAFLVMTWKIKDAEKTGTR